MKGPNWRDWFDPDKARGPRRAPDVGEDAGDEILPGNAPAPLTVSALIRRIKNALADAFPQRTSVVGELSNVKRHSSGHVYFRLKDADAAIDAVMWRSDAARLKFQPEDGLEVVAEGRVDVYDVRGQLQLYVERMTPRGQGALELAFRQLIEKLEGEGLFDPARKKPIARFPRAIGVVTSRTGAAIRDIRRTLRRRWPAARVYLLPALVQGDHAAEEIAEAIRLLDANAERLGIDTLIVGRGGGSLEDLWAFNEEAVARAIFAAGTPIISAVGHEVDVTVADMVADVRAATPTAAAELAVPDREEVGRNLTSLAARLERMVRDGLGAARTALAAVLRSAVFRDPAGRLRTQVQRVDEASHRLRAGLGGRLTEARRRLEPAANRLAALHPARLHERGEAGLAALTSRLAWALGRRSKRAGDALSSLQARLLAVHPAGRLKLAEERVAAMARQLEAMSYRRVLQRGFSVTRGPAGAILRSAAEPKAGDRIETELTDGRIASTVDRPDRSRPPKAPRTTRKTSPPPAPSLFD